MPSGRGNDGRLSGWTQYAVVKEDAVQKIQ